ncbi:unnamed protein product [Musa acuminata subsp. burmannicoides]
MADSVVSLSSSAPHPEPLLLFCGAPRRHGWFLLDAISVFNINLDRDGLLGNLLGRWWWGCFGGYCLNCYSRFPELRGSTGFLVLHRHFHPRSETELAIFVDSNWDASLHMLRHGGLAFETAAVSFLGITGKVWLTLTVGFLDEEVEEPLGEANRLCYFPVHVVIHLLHNKHGREE